MKSNQEIQARRDKAFPKGMGNTYPVYVDHALNSEIWDVEGNRYIDFGAGIAVCNTGHSHPDIVKAVQEQVARFSHTCVMVNPYEEAVELAEKLNALAPGDTPKKTVFVTTGAEAVENAVKVARAHTGRRGVLAFAGGFHGRTNMAMGLTGKILPYKHSFGPFPGDIYHLPYPMAVHDITIEDTKDALNRLLKSSVAVEDIAAVIIEPVQGEGGFYPAPKELMVFLREFCDQHGIVMIADEIQTGFGRTGEYFCTQYSGIEPDLMTMAKGIAGGYPLSAVVGKAHMMDAAMPGGLGGTYGGSPVACAAALAVLKVMEAEKLPERARGIGEVFQRRLGELKDRYADRILDIRVNGAMVAIEFGFDGDGHKPDTELTRQVIAEAAGAGLVLLSCGYYGNVIRFLPPLTIQNDVLEEGLDRFAGILDKLLG